MKIKDTRFEKSATRPAHYPTWDVHEVAFAGRSNVGKSSLLNTLIERKGLVKVSRKPGHTRLLNFFHATLGDDRGIGLVDLPGYGFARVPPEEQAQWQKMIETFLRTRQQLRGLVLVMDVRRGMTDMDTQLLFSLGHFGVQPICVFTKADKLTRNQQWARQRELAKELGFPLENVIIFSSLTGLGRDALWDRIANIVLPARAEDVPELEAVNDEAEQ